ncbi:MAG TPA: aspartate-semialdehyde dehydrogenase [Actinomycetota bacterium]
MGYRVGVVGATGLVGEVALRILEERKLPVDELRVFASQRSAGRKLPWAGGEVQLELPTAQRLRGLDVAIGATSSELARVWVPVAVAEGVVVVDNSSAYRMDPDVPLVIPEINPQDLERHRGIVANPNCTAAVALMAVAPIHKAARILSMISTSFQSVSGTGRAALEEMLEQAGKAVDQVDALRGDEPLDLPDPRAYPHLSAFNVIPQCETFPTGDTTTTEEAKLAGETRKILGDPDIVVHATAVRVPVAVGHAVSLSLSLERPLSPEEARDLVAAAPGVALHDEPWDGDYPTPLRSAGLDDVLVGRIRANTALPNGLAVFAAGDNLRKGAALNTIQIAEALLGFEP